MKRLEQVRGICFHHSATADGKIRDADGIRHYHMHPAHNGKTITQEEYNRLKAQGTKDLKPAWEDIGYHYLIEDVRGEIQIVMGRSLNFQGAHCPDLNATHIGICLVGNFDLAPPADALLKAASNLARSLMTTYHIPAKGLVYHCDYPPYKTCPGSKFPKAGFLLEILGEERP